MIAAASLTMVLCLITAISRIFLKKGLQTSNAITGMVMSIIIGAFALGVAALFFSPWPQNADWRGFAFFAMIGVVAPPVVRYLTYIGIDRLGASRSDPARSLTVFFAIFFAIIFLDEAFDPKIILGAVLTFVGVIFLSRPEKGTAEEARKWDAKDFLYPIGAAVLSGAVANLRKYGAGLLDAPIIAAAVAAASAVIVFGLFLLFTGRHSEIRLNANSWKYFLLAGVCTAVTDVLDLVALKLGSVSVVSPLLASSPLFVIALSHLFLKDVEKINRTVIVGALTIFIGIQIIFMAAK